MRRWLLIVACAVAACRAVSEFENFDQALQQTSAGEAGVDAAIDAGPYVLVLRSGEDVSVTDPALTKCDRLRARIWGAGGGNFIAEEQYEVPGGPGGYTEIVWKPAPGDGFRYTVGTAGNQTAGGVPGGGRSGDTKGYFAAGGGGYSSIALPDGSVLAIAGGGGGACFETDGIGGPGRGGAGGGVSGLNGGGSFPGLGGTASVGGDGGGRDDASTSPGSSGNDKTGGAGGGNRALIFPSAGGGGGGYRGGGGGGANEEPYCGGGGGGSGFVDNTRVISGTTVASDDGGAAEYNDRDRAALRGGAPAHDGLIIVYCDEDSPPREIPDAGPDTPIR